MVIGDDFMAVPNNVCELNSSYCPAVIAKIAIMLS